MENGSSLSLDGNFLESLATDEKKQAQSGNPAMDSFLGGLAAEEAGKVQAAARWSKQFQPDAYAKAAKIAPGLSPEVGARQMATLEDRARLEAYRQVFDKAPTIRSYYAANPKELPYANPDELDQFTSVNWAIRAFPAAFSAGVEQTQLGYIRYQQLAGTSTPEQDALAEVLSAKPARTFGNHGDWVSSGIVGLAQSAPGMIMNVLNAAYRGAQGAVGGAAVGGASGFMVGGAGAVPGAVAGAAVGGRVGAAYGSLEQAIQLQSGLAYDEFRKMRDENGMPLDGSLAKWAAIVTGVGSGGLEQLGLAKTIGQIPGLDRLYGALTLPGMKRALGNPGIRNALLDFTKNLGEAVTVETLTEMGQEGLAILGGELAKEASGQDFKMMTGEEIASRIGSAGLQALQVMTLFGPVTSGTRFAGDLYQMQKSKKASDNLKKLAQDLEGNGFIERAPTAAAKVIDANSGDQKLYIPAEEMKELFQSQGLDIYGPELPNWRTRFDEALTTGGDVQVSLGEFLTALGTDPKANPLYDLVRSDPRDYLPGEMKEYSDAMDELLGSEIAKADAAVLPAKEVDTTVKDSLKEQITAAGFLPDAAEHYSTMLDAYFRTRAKQLGVTPAAFAEMNGVLIQRTDESNTDTIENGNTDSQDSLFQPSAAFQNWFGRSQAVDEQNTPLRMYHGSLLSFEQFRRPKDGAGRARALYFTPDVEVANLYAESGSSERGVMYPVYLKTENLKTIDFKGEAQVGGKGREQLVREAEEEGFDGVRLLNTRDAGGVQEQWAVFEPTQVKSVNNQGTFDPIDPRMLFQENRGSISFQKEGPALIKLFGQADMSTLLHEAGHFFLQTTRDLAQQSPEIAADWEVIKKHLSIGDDNKITRSQHEQFARWAEAYFMEGKAPTPELRSAFQAFRQWLKAIYRSIKKLGGKLHPEIVSVFDNMLRVEKRVDVLAADSPYAPLFKSAEEMGVAPEDYLEYQRLVEDLRSEAQDSVIGRVVGQQVKFSKGWRAAVKKQLASEAEKKLKLQAPYSHIETFKNTDFRISTEAFTKKYGQEAAKKFPRQAFNKAGLDPTVAAELLGYPSADDMVYDFVQAPSLKEAATQAAEAEMTARYGDNFQQQEVLDAAVSRALSEEGRVVILAKEYKALSARAGRNVSEKAPRQLAAEIARRTLYVKKYKDVNPRSSAASAKRAGTMSEAAMLKGDWSKAADWKRKQILAQALDSETQELNKTLEKIRDKAARYTRTAPKGIDPATMEQIRALVTQYEFARVPLKKLARRESLREYLDKAAAEGLVVNVPDYLLRQAGRVNYRELTVEELLGFGSVLDNLEHVGRLKQRLRTAKGQREFAAVKKEILESIARRPTKEQRMKNYAEPEKGLREKLMGFHASFLKPEQIMEWLDAGDLYGPMAEYVFQPIADAQGRQNELLRDYNARVMEILDKVDPAYLSEIVNITSLRTKFTREQIYSVALNMGNDSNRQKLIEGELWTEQQLAEILSHMGKKDWDRVQKVWNVLDTLWEKIAAMEKRLTGVAPPRIEAREFTNVHGTYAGGYYPVIYDFKARRGLNLLEDTTPADQQARVEDLFPQRFVKPGTNHVHTYARQKVAKPIKLSLNVLPGHLHNVIHDLAYREAVRSAFKVLWDPDIRRAISGVESEQTYLQLQHWLQKVASEHSVEDDPNTQFIARLRTGVTMFGMGYRVTTAIAQPLGLFPALTRVSARHMVPAIYQMIRHPQSSLDLVNGLSAELRDRFNQQDRDIRDTVNQFTRTETVLDKARHYAFYFIGAMDKFVATATWLGAYKQQLEQNAEDGALAIHAADRAVRLTQGTGTVKDMAKVTNDTELLKLFTMFYSFFSAQYNMQVDLTRKTKRDIAEGEWNTLLTERLPQWAYLVLFPAIFGALLTGQGPEDDEDKLAWAFRKTVLYPISAVPFARDLVGVLDAGYDYKFSPAGKAIEETGRSLQKLMAGDPMGAAKPAATAAAIFFKLPAGQAIATVESLWTGLAQGDLEAKDLIYGRRDK